MDKLREKDVPSKIRMLLDIYGEMTTSEVIEHIGEVYNLTPLDLKKSNSRNDPNYTQTIRNLALHKKPLLENGDVTFPEGVILSMDKTKNRDKYTYTLATVPSYKAKATPINNEQINDKRKSGQQFQARKVNFEDINTKNTQLGDLGELFVLNKEIEFAETLGLEEMVIHTSHELGDGTGFDISSVNEDGSPIYIEVKTTTGNSKTPFYMSINEYNFFELYSSDAFLYRVYNFDIDTKEGEIIKYTAKEIIDNFKFVPSSFKVSPGS